MIVFELRTAFAVIYRGLDITIAIVRYTCHGRYMRQDLELPRSDYDPTKSRQR